MRQATRYFLLFYGLLESFIFTGNIFGWNSLQYMLREEGIYQYLCEDLDIYANENGSIPGNSSFLYRGFETKDERFSATVEIRNLTDRGGGVSKTLTCDAQDRVLNLAFTIGSFCLGASACVWGFLLDKWGLRYVRLIINGLLTTGTVLLSLTEKESSYLVFPSLILMCLAGVPLRLADMQIADLFPKQRSTIITLYSGAFGASASVFVFIKYGYSAGLPWEWACFLLVIFSIIMLPVTLFVLPTRKIEEPSSCKKGLFSSADCTSEVAGIATSVWGTYYIVEESLHGTVRKPSSAGETKSDVKAAKEAEAKDNTCKKIQKNGFLSKSSSNRVPLIKSLCTMSYMLHQYWFCWLLLFTIVFVGTLDLWSERSFNESGKGEIFGELYGLVQVSGLFLAPLGGVFMDWRVAKAAKESDPQKRRLKVLQSNFWPLILTSLLAVVAQVAKFFDSPEAIVISILFVTLFRTFLLSIGTAYLRIRFPAEHFGRLLGIMSTMSAMFTLLQFPLFLWETISPQSVLHVNIFDSVCLLMACSHPLLLLVTPLQKRFIRKEQRSNPT